LTGLGRRRPKRRRGHRTLVITLVVFALLGGGYLVLSPHGTPAGRSTAVVGVEAGDQAPPMTIYLTNGTTTSLSSFRGRTVLLWMVATWCPGCQETAPIVASQYYSQLRGEGVTILTVEDYNDLGYPGPTVGQFASRYIGDGSNYPGWLFAGTSQSATFAYNPQADLDLWYLISPEGSVAAGGVNLGTSLQEVLSDASNLKGG
jgi:thiol-disulfide isomerase/thioredoxin